MRYLSLIFICLLFSLGSQAQKKANQKAVDNLSTSIQNNVINPLNAEVTNLQNQIDAIQLKIERIKNRRFVKRTNGNSMDFLSKYATFAEIYEDRENIKDNLSTDESGIAQTYLLAIKMKESLERVYNEKTNAQYIEQASSCKAILPQHRAEFDELVSMINDYNYYMFELARLFVAADEDGYKTSAKALADREDASYLIKVPYTKKVLTEYITRRGVLPQNYKFDLKKGCPDAFSELK